MYVLRKGFPYNPMTWGWDSYHQSYEFSGGVWILRDSLLRYHLSTILPTIFGYIIQLLFAVPFPIPRLLLKKPKALNRNRDLKHHPLTCPSQKLNLTKKIHRNLRQYMSNLEPIIRNSSVRATFATTFELPGRVVDSDVW